MFFGVFLCQSADYFQHRRAPRENTETAHKQAGAFTSAQRGENDKKTQKK